LAGTELLEGCAKIPAWRAAFDALDEMPKAQAGALHQRFEFAIGLCNAQLAKQRLRDTEQSIANLLEAGRYIVAYESAVARNLQSSEREALKQAAKDFIASVPQWPKGGLKAVNEVLARAGCVSQADIVARERALRMLCIRCEIHSDTPTPSEDEVLRREYQVQRLAQGMGQFTRAEEQDWDGALLEWIRIGGIPPALYDSLQKRFTRSWAKRRREEVGVDHITDTLQFVHERSA